jgi:polar amino acid transport system substrate-binding protein
MTSFRKTAAASALLLAFAIACAAAEDASRDVAPTGALRVAIAVGPAASTFWATRDPQSGEPRGVTVELAKAAAQKLHVPLALVAYKNSGEIAAAASKDGWDITFMPADAEREKYVDQGPSYVVYESSYLTAGANTCKRAST